MSFKQFPGFTLGNDDNSLRKEFVLTYVLNRANCNPNGLSGKDAMKAAYEAWDKYLEEENSRTRG